MQESLTSTPPRRDRETICRKWTRLWRWHSVPGSTHGQIMPQRLAGHARRDGSMFLQQGLAIPPTNGMRARVGLVDGAERAFVYGSVLEHVFQSDFRAIVDARTAADTPISAFQPANGWKWCSFAVIANSCLVVREVGVMERACRSPADATASGLQPPVSTMIHSDKERLS